MAQGWIIYIEDYENSAKIRNSAGSTWNGSELVIEDDGFSWKSLDSSWGTQTVSYYAIK